MRFGKNVRNHTTERKKHIMRKSKLLCILLAIVLIIGLSGSGFAITIGEATEATIGTDKDVPEEKIFSTATLDDDFADDRVMVVLTNAASLKLKAYKSSDFSEIQCTSVNDLSTAAAARVEAKLNGKSVAAVHELEPDAVVFSDFYEVNTDTYNQILCLTLPTKSKQGVLDAIKILSQRDDVKYAGPDYAMTIASTTPNDTYYSSQWALPKIKMPQAWDIHTGRSGVLVGVLDTGIESTHSDFARNVNTALSRSYVGTTATQNPNGHGTHVAGIIGAKGNNSTGIAGVVWNVKLVSLQVFNSAGIGYSSYLASAVNYAQSKAIPILNFSGGWPTSSEYYNVNLEETLENYSGLFVCAAGNESSNIDGILAYHPAEINLPNVITVGASTQSDTKCAFSNYGATTVDIFAPGEDIYSTYTMGTHTYMSGTSMAAPHVTGVAALMLSECSGLTASAIRSKIISNDDNVNSLSGYCVSGGRLNAYKALSNAHSYVTMGADFMCLYCADITHEVP